MLLVHVIASAQLDQSLRCRHEQGLVPVINFCRDFGRRFCKQYNLKPGCSNDRFLMVCPLNENGRKLMSLFM